MRNEAWGKAELFNSYKEGLKQSQSTKHKGYYYSIIAPNTMLQNYKYY